MSSIISENNEVGIRGLSIKGIIGFVEWIDNYYHSVELGVWMNIDGMPFGDNPEVKFTTAELLEKYLSEPQTTLTK